MVTIQSIFLLEIRIPINFAIALCREKIIESEMRNGF